MGIERYAERKVCRMCHSGLRRVFSLTPTPIANSYPDKPNTGEYYPLDLMECVNCGHVQLKHVIFGLFENYKYESPAQSSPHLKNLAKTLRERYPEAKRLLEIGANNGLFLDAAEKQGFEVVGVDPNIDLGKYPNSFKGYFNEDIAGDMGKFDLIVTINTFAHINDLDSVFRGINKVLADDGSIIIEVQDFSQITEKGIFDTIYHEHLDYHDSDSFAYFLNNHGLAGGFVFEKIPSQGGSMRITTEREKLDTIIAPYKKHIDWADFQYKIEQARNKVLYHARLAKKLVAWGAPAKATTLIHHFGLQDKIAYCVDDSPLKQGKYIPGTAIRIYPSSKLKEDPPDMVLLTAWNFEEAFKEKYPNLKYINPYS